MTALLFALAGEEGSDMAWSDIAFVFAFVLFVIGTALAVHVQTLWAALVSAGLAAVALGWLLL